MVASTTVRSNCVVIFPLSIDDKLYSSQTAEHLVIKQFVLNAGFEAFTLSVHALGTQVDLVCLTALIQFQTVSAINSGLLSG